MSLITIAYASRFGSTAKLAAQIAAGLEGTGARAQLLDVATAGGNVEPQSLIVLTSIIWDRPIPVMRDWIGANATMIRERIIACGVVCGAAGVRETGGRVYARQLATRIGRPDVFQFALSGQIPERNELRGWEWVALKLFAGVMRKPQLFTIRADMNKAMVIGKQVGEQLRK
jgi:menaquinone-dependent protoporphyrinogen IX oxidase